MTAWRARHALAVLALLLSGGLWPWLAHAVPPITVLVSEPAGIYQETASSLVQALNRSEWKVHIVTPERYAPGGSALTIAIGTRALEKALAQPGRPVLSLLVPRLSYERLAAGQQQVSALYLDQPLSRQLQLLSLALPGLKKAGVPLGPYSRSLLPALQSAARSSGIQADIVSVQQGADLYSALNELAQDSQAFLLLPDPLVAQRGTLQSFFLHTYRLRRPVLAYSAPLVQSGALLGLYATPAQLGEEAADWIRESWSKGAFRLGEPRYPRRYTIAVNRTVAHSLDIELPQVEVLSRQLEAML